jgi:hypothetical protein
MGNIVRTNLVATTAGGVFSYISLQNNFFVVLAPVIPSATGPRLEVIDGGHALNISWSWPTYSFDQPPPPEGPPPWALSKEEKGALGGFGGQALRSVPPLLHLPGSSLSVTLHLPGDVFITKPDPRQQSARDEDVAWAFFVYETNLSSASAIEMRPRQSASSRLLSRCRSAGSKCDIGSVSAITRSLLK